MSFFDSLVEGLRGEKIEPVSEPTFDKVQYLVSYFVRSSVPIPDNVLNAFSAKGRNIFNVSAKIERSYNVVVLFEYDPEKEVKSEHVEAVLLSILQGYHKGKITITAVNPMPLNHE